MGSGNDEGESEALTVWIRKSLQAGDSPEIIKEALNNRGFDAGLVDLVLKTTQTMPQEKKIEALPQNEPEPEFSNTCLKDDVESIMSFGVAKPAATNATAPKNALRTTDKTNNGIFSGGANKQEAKAAPSQFSRYSPSISDKLTGAMQSILQRLGDIEVPHFGIPFPKSLFEGTDSKTARYLIGVLLFAALIAAMFYGLNWYADQAAKNLVS